MGYKRIILKLTGKALAGDTPLNEISALNIVEEIAPLHHQAIEIGIVIGGGNIVRGRQGLPLTTKSVKDEIGMLATMQNALFLQDHLEQNEIKTHVQTACEMPDFAGKYYRRKAKTYLEEKNVVIFACGTGNTAFTTDSAAALRAYEMKAEAILKGTSVEGFFKNYPPKDKNDLIKEISYRKIMSLLPNDVLDMDALALLMRQKCEIPIHIFNIFKKGNLLKVVQGKKIGTKIVP